MVYVWRHTILCVFIVKWVFSWTLEFVVYQRLFTLKLLETLNSLTFKFVVQLTGELHKNKCPTNNNECTVYNLCLNMKENKLGKPILTVWCWKLDINLRLFSIIKKHPFILYNSNVAEKFDTIKWLETINWILVFILSLC